MGSDWTPAEANAVATHFADTYITPTLRAGDIVWLASWLHEPFPFTTPPHYMLANATRRRAYVQQLAILYKAVEAAGASLVLSNDVPLLRFGARKCADAATWNQRHGLAELFPPACAVALAASHDNLRQAADTLRDFSAAHPKAFFFDVHDELCDGDLCGPWIPRTEVPRGEDKNHLSRWTQRTQRILEAVSIVCPSTHAREYAIA